MKWREDAGVVVAASLTLLALTLFSLTVFAAEKRLLWDAPTTREDGTPFDMATEGDGYRVTWEKGAESGDLYLPPTATSMPLTEYRPGTVFTIVACDNQEPPLCSGPSNEAKLTGAPPAAPGRARIE